LADRGRDLAILRNDAIYELAELVPIPAREHGGRRSVYPPFMIIAYEALISVFRSARRVETEISHPLVWDETTTVPVWQLVVVVFVSVAVIAGLVAIPARVGTRRVVMDTLRSELA
jgi:hypothetical protein